jgi:aldehyde dehydrogenase (NAD+)
MNMLPEGRLYIDGVLRKASDGRTYEDIGPWTGQVVAKAADASAGDVNEAIAAARRAFDRTDWSLQHDVRFGLVTQLCDALLANRDKLVEIARHEVGSSLGTVFGAQVDGALNGARGLLEVFPQVKWEEDRGRREDYGIMTQRLVAYEAIGVVGAITPWNVPFYINFAKVFSALLAGCTLVLKPAPETPLAGVILGELAVQIGFPPGVFNVVTSSDPAMAGEMLVTDPRVDLISFTGSTAVGRRIMEKGAPTLKRAFLELGGKSATIVLEDAPDFAMTAVRAGGMVCYHAGQGCATQTRLLVPKSRYAEAVGALQQGFAALGSKWGDFDDPTQIMGPVISRRQLDRIMGYIELGKKDGARLLAGGQARPDKGSGFFVEPTCFVDVSNTMRIAREEIFGPVLSVIPFENDEDAVRIANDSEYGLSGGVISASHERAMRVARRIRSGTVSVNGGVCIAPDLPFGGYKGSGIGREWGREGIEEYLETKVIGSAAP